MTSFHHAPANPPPVSWVPADPRVALDSKSLSPARIRARPDVEPRGDKKPRPARRALGGERAVVEPLSPNRLVETVRAGGCDWVFPIGEGDKSMVTLHGMLQRETLVTSLDNQGFLARQ